MWYRHLAVASVLLALAAPAARSADNEPDGDRKIRDTVDRAQEAEERAKRNDRAPAETDTDADTGEEPGLLGAIARAFFEVFFQVMFENAATLRFAAYPYSPESPYFHNTSTWILPEERKLVSLQVSSEVANYLDGTWGNGNRVVAQLTGLHLNVYQLGVFSESEGFSVLSANAGITFFVPGFLLSGFAGAYTLDVLQATYLSFGFACQVFLPRGIHVDLFNVNGVIGDQIWSHWQGTAELSLWRFSIGAGWQQNLIAGTLYMGPCLRASFWL